MTRRIASNGDILVTAVILTKNEERVIKRTIDALGRVEQVLVVDSNSDDSTAEIARDSGADVVNFSWDGRYPKKKQWALEHSSIRNDWVLFVDADEHPSEELLSSIEAAVGSTGKAERVAYDAQLDYWFMGRLLRHGHKVRKRILLNRRKCRFPEVNDLGVRNMWEVEGHYQPSCDGKIGALDGTLYHQDVDPLYDYFSRHNRYSDWEAFLATDETSQKQVRQGRTGGGKIFDRLPFKPIFFFLYSYVVRRGFVDGRAGFHYAVALSFYYWQCSVKESEIKNFS